MAKIGGWNGVTRGSISWSANGQAQVGVGLAERVTIHKSPSSGRDGP